MKTHGDSGTISKIGMELLQSQKKQITPPRQRNMQQSMEHHGMDQQRSIERNMNMPQPDPTPPPPLPPTLPHHLPNPIDFKQALESTAPHVHVPSPSSHHSETQSPIPMMAVVTTNAQPALPPPPIEHEYITAANSMLYMQYGYYGNFPSSF
jgi:hypothetical protein